MSDTVVIRPATTGLCGEVTFPGDKSISHRAVMLAAVAHGTSHIRHCSTGGDNRSTIQALQTLGVDIQQRGDEVTVTGCGWDGLRAPARVIDCGNSGTTMRLLAGLLAARSFTSRLDGDASLRRRPMGRVIVPLRTMGAAIASEGGDDRAPLRIDGRPLHGISYRTPVASAQVKSALVLAGLQAQGCTQIWEPVRSRDHTERLLPAFGGRVTVEDTVVTVEGGQELHACDLEVPGDLSSAAFFIGAALIVPGSELYVRNVGLNPTRTGALDIFRAMGGEITVLHERERYGEPVGDLVVRTSALQGTEIAGEFVVRAIDEFPIIAVVAACARGTTTIRGAEELRVKESDRLHALATSLRALGIEVAELPDGLVITGGRLRGGQGQSFGDHRIAMALSVAGLAGTGEMVLKGVDSVAISFPGFYDLVRELTGPTVTHI
ncbi:MAG: 3-phosphoshikimate 1-carboxyvinyltransferase [Candidatus Binatia bacterium]|nr:3-phosphoshikimate 1-carboxyvinyltransferase [Candidatus Binatia bacterium]